jgi:hypothetical protein
MPFITTGVHFRGNYGDAENRKEYRTFIYYNYYPDYNVKNNKRVAYRLGRYFTDIYSRRILYSGIYPVFNNKVNN